MKLVLIAENNDSSLFNALVGLRQYIATSAQDIYDEWMPDEFDNGGICDEISRKIGEILSMANIDNTEGGHDGDDHSFIIAYNDHEAYIVDIPYDVYEHGGGYNWSKVHDVKFGVEDVVISKTAMPDWVDHG